jgi:hypothetical protein
MNFDDDKLSNDQTKEEKNAIFKKHCMKIVKFLEEDIFGDI